MAAEEAEGMSLEVAAGVVGNAATAGPAQGHAHKKFQGKRKRRTSNEGKQPRGGGGGGGRHHGGHRTPHKKAKLNVSSTRAANNIMKFRLGGSVSDPLNLEGGDILEDECSTCAPSPVTQTNEELIPPPLLTPHLNKDPLNLEGKVKNFPLPGMGGGAVKGKAVSTAGQRRKPRRRTTSGSKPEDSVKSIPKDGKFRYGNYNRYYGYRNSGVNESDPRLSLLRKEWLEGQDCLDIGCNTGQVTIKLAKDMCPRTMVGMDIDHSLVKTAWKNLHRSYTPSLAPDGQPFPSSLTMCRGPVDFPPAPGCSSQASVTVEADQQHRGNIFPYNIQFVHGNYMPQDEASALSQVPQFDVILALSLSKWIHLNWGDAGIKRFFKKVYHHLRPGGKFILEPQPFKCYARKKKLSEEIFRNYQNIRFRPDQFQSYLLSRDVGFTEHKYLGTPDNKSKGFQRPIHMYLKGKEESSSNCAELPLRTQSALSSTSSASEDTGRLKSVVQVVSMQPPAEETSKTTQEE